ncbi:leucyl aminopeptidase [Enterovirga rhinocerotis]|uniref:Probable cytosol aminopeptidase n=1 Tax=Enterovirga rhinocerotis TaxID=1339210 RepID=A0A4R7BV16_9HYPH|nr:leucyl aminopeptidase [Enterovirga rhinocerotis]TDR89243.1 leucyl aminopeptidase [Enterovirga rhinocerotis]
MDRITIAFRPVGAAAEGDLVVFVRDDLVPVGGGQPAALAELIRRAAAAERFKGKAKAVMTVPAPAGLDGIASLHVVGLGAKDGAGPDWRLIGGAIAGRVSGREATVLADLGEGADALAAVAEMVLGARLRSYRWDRFKSKKPDADEAASPTRLTFAVADAAGAERADAAGLALAEGINLARDLVHEPPNVLFPEEFARRAQALDAVGVEVEVLGEEDLRTIGMRALVAVGDGSAHDSCVALMQWKGGAPDEPPICFVGKGVCFDSGGISIKPSGGMEDMKGDMAGAATVVGLMHALAARKAKVNVIGAIGLTENMPDGKAQRPGDIITTLSGQTVEMVNSDAEGRLVLGDVLWYVQDRYKPKMIVDLATLTGAILVALAQEYAGLFSNSDELADRLIAAGRKSGELVWRMPLAPAYDKLIDSKFADMKNTGGRHGGSITAAQFLQRYVRDGLPWAHLDIAGTGMNAPQTDINKTWSAGWGVRLLEQLVRDNYEEA